MPVRTIRDVMGYEIDLMSDAYMGWTLDYARRMLCEVITGDQARDSE